MVNIKPDPSVSNKSKASLISCFCSSVNSMGCVVFPFTLDVELEDAIGFFKEDYIFVVSRVL